MEKYLTHVINLLSAVILDYFQIPTKISLNQYNFGL